MLVRSLKRIGVATTPLRKPRMERCCQPVARAHWTNTGVRRWVLKPSQFQGSTGSVDAPYGLGLEGSASNKVKYTNIMSPTNGQYSIPTTLARNLTLVAAGSAFHWLSERFEA